MRYLLLLLLLVSAQVNAQLVIAFKGKDNVFDSAAIKQYATHKNLDYIILSAHETHTALNIVTKFVPSKYQYYELYGYSLGAASAGLVARSAKIKPELIISIAPYKGLDVNYSKYGIPYYNFFDNSSLPAISPGLILQTDHWSVQQKSVDILLKK